MPPAINLKYRKMPSFFFLRSPLYAFWGRSKGFHGKESIPSISVELEGMKISRAHLSRFNTICQVENNGEITIIYPMTLAFPFFQRILSLKEAPLSMFNVLGKNLNITQRRPLGLDEALDIFCEISGVRIVSRGLEIDLSAIIQAAGETVWTATETFFYKGHFGEPDTDVENAPFESIPGAKMVAEWFLPGGLGFRFARISGDGNGIHYSKFYARRLGFERDFAQPFLVLGNAVNHLIDYAKRNAISLHAAFKGPCYYERKITIKAVTTESRNRFDIYNEGNERPCISGILNDQVPQSEFIP